MTNVINVSMLSFYCCNALQLNRNGCWQRINFNCGSAGLSVFKILSIQLIVHMKVTFHIDEKHCNVHKVIPITSGSLENISHVIEHISALRLEVE